MSRHKHTVAVHEGHDLIYDGDTVDDSECCGGITYFKFCPVCGETLILQDHLKTYDEEK